MKVSNASRVPIDLFVMSRCPDALDCENRMDEVLKAVGSIATVHMHYIANVSDEPGVPPVCKHGPIECAGNVQQLCVQMHAPAALWPFVRCQDASPQDIGEPPLAKKCLDEVAALVSDKESYNCMSCFKDGEGASLLAASGRKTRDLGVRWSCTVWVAGSDKCADASGGPWRTCESGTSTEDYVATVCTRAAEASGGRWPAGCPPKP
ncbi:hypothetical protein FOA52_002979 [Chlamydomonas sp. UWO 241]|nr:hypothetical protein FOA52_002979 [Chlamydomonas sp. UWO 241]